MLTLTEAAGAHLVEILADKNCPDDTAVRVVCKESRVSLVLDNEKPGDSTLEHEGRTVLLLDHQAAEHLGDETVNVEPTEAGVRLFLTRRSQGSA